MEECPPLTAADLKKDLQNESFSSYFYIGSNDDVGWENAEIVYGLFSRLRVYLVKDPTIVADWADGKRPKGIVFGWGEKPKQCLNKAETEDLKTVITAITNARGES